MNFGKKKRIQRSIDLTSMIDVVFLILLFFVVSAVLNISRSIDIRLPTAESGEKQPLAAPPVLNITKNSKFIMNGQTITTDKLLEHLTKINAGKNNGVLVIRADGNVKHQTVVFAMDAGKRAGFHKLSIQTAKKRN